MSKDTAKTFAKDYGDAQYLDYRMNLDQKNLDPVCSSSSNSINNNNKCFSPFDDDDDGWDKAENPNDWGTYEDALNTSTAVTRETYQNFATTSHSNKKTLNQEQFFASPSSNLHDSFEIRGQKQNVEPKAPEIMVIKKPQQKSSRNFRPRANMSFYNKIPSNNNNRSRLSSTRSSVFNASTNASSSPLNTTTATGVSSCFNKTKTISTPFQGGYDVTGEEIQKRLNQVHRRKPPKDKTKSKVFVFPDYTLSKEELLRYHRAKYISGAGQFWAVIEIIKASPKKELPFKLIVEVYHFLYGVRLEEKTLRDMFNTDPSVFARQIFLDLKEVFKVTGHHPDFSVSLVHPERDYVPAYIREQEHQCILRNYNIDLRNFSPLP